MSEAENKAISNSKNYNLMYFCAKCQPMVENISRTITQTETDVATVKETVGQINENRSSGKHYGQSY